MVIDNNEWDTQSDIDPVGGEEGVGKGVGKVSVWKSMKDGKEGEEKTVNRSEEGCLLTSNHHHLPWENPSSSLTIAAIHLSPVICYCQT